MSRTPGSAKKQYFLIQGLKYLFLRKKESHLVIEQHLSGKPRERIPGSTIQGSRRRGRSAIVGGSFRAGFEQGALKYVENIPQQSEFRIATTFATLWKDLPGYTDSV